MMFLWIIVVALIGIISSYGPSFAMEVAVRRSPTEIASEKANRCAECSKQTQTMCSRCHASFFCSVACQKKQWPSHKALCNQIVQEEQDSDAKDRVEKLSILKNTLLSNPEAVLQEIRVLQDEFYKGLAKVKEVFQQNMRSTGILDAKARIAVESHAASRYVVTFSELLRSFEKRNPFFLLAECSQKSHDETHQLDTCPYNRFKHPLVRRDYAKVVNDAIIKRIKGSSRAVHCVFFATGGLFQELVILTKVLTAEPRAKLVIHCIDAQYDLYEWASRVLDKKYRDVTEYKPIVPQVMKKIDFITEFLNASTHAKGSREWISAFEIVENCFWVQEIVHQLSRALQEMFPEACLSFYVHDTTVNYNDYIKQSSFFEHADVVTSIDIEDSYCTKYNALSDYIGLSYMSSKIKERSKNITTLFQEGQGLRICSFALSKDAKKQGMVMREPGMVEISLERTIHALPLADTYNDSFTD